MDVLSVSFRGTRSLLFSLILAGPALCSPFLFGEEKTVDYDRDIRPILSEKCYTCHGPDAKNRKAKLRLDDRSSVLRVEALVPGDVDASELHHRIHQTDPDELMPPPESKRTLTVREKMLIDQWISEGAKYNKHWAFVAPRRPALPKLTDSLQNWPRNGIDYFVANKLAAKDLRPSPAADKETLIRRVTLDLTGLPPTPAEVDQFLADQSSHSYEDLVDRLLKTDQYGERMALPWLDAARYADTGGYQGDVEKTQWPWRDWVVRAYNRNIPFDQFTIDQLAGDLLPQASEEQRLATAFNRNHRINDEGGIIPEEFLVEYVADRVETTSTVWMGLTVGCARCHDHKYDPITQKDFYHLFAFFHNLPEKGKDGDLAPKPNMPVYTGGTRKEHQSLLTKVESLRKKRDGYKMVHKAILSSWITEQGKAARRNPVFAELPEAVIHLPLDESVRNRFQNLGNSSGAALIQGNVKAVKPNQEAHFHQGALFGQGGYLNLQSLSGKEGFNSAEAMSWSFWANLTNDIFGVEGPVFSCLSSDEKAQGYEISLVERDDESFQVAFRLQRNRSVGARMEVVSERALPRKQFAHIVVTCDGSMKAAGVRIYFNGEPVQGVIRADKAGAPFTSKKDLLVGSETEASAPNGIRDELLHNTILDDIRIYRAALTGKQVKSLHDLSPVELLAARSKRNGPENQFLSKSFFRDSDPEYRKLNEQLSIAEKQLKTFEVSKITNVSIMEEMKKPRDTFLLERGAYDHPDKSEKLQPATFVSFPPMAPGLPKNRLGLAQWLMQPEHPLTARVAVNRYWQMYFGRGLVKTQEDFGTQGSPPTHPKLLDWLAVEFRESGWNVKAMQKLIVMSATYRQSSIMTPDLLKRDPENLLLARGPRFRLYPQALRDQALAICGKLNSTLGGPPVMPYQPAGLWEEVSAKGKKYIVGSGSDLYRRSLYTFWRRTVPPPSMMNFDSATREACSVGSVRTNTPLQAMNLMNDPQYVEAARILAGRMIREGGDSPGDQIRFGYKLALAREPDGRVSEILTRGYLDYLTSFQAAPGNAKSLIEIGKSRTDEGTGAVQLAAMTAVASVILNLDETVTKE